MIWYLHFHCNMRLVSSPQNCFDWPTVVYDECSSDLQNLTSSNTLRLVLIALEDMGKVSYVLQGVCVCVFASVVCMMS